MFKNFQLSVGEGKNEGDKKNGEEEKRVRRRNEKGRK